MVNRILTCTWAPTVIGAPQLLRGQDRRPASLETFEGDALRDRLIGPVRRAESLGIDHLLVAQRWWGSGEEIEASTYDCFAMTAWYAALTERIRLVTAVHPGFVLPGPAAKWGATLDRISGGRWAINVTSGWHEREFGMYGADLVEHDLRYARSREFIDILRGAWAGDSFSYRGDWYTVDDLRLEPRPLSPSPEIWQGGQSGPALDMAASHSDWMFLNGGPPEKIGPIIDSVRERCRRTGRTVRFALYAVPVCRETDREAEEAVEAMISSIDEDRAEARQAVTGGAQGMWAPSADRLTLLDSNEGFASRLIGSPRTILDRVREFHELGIDCFHLALGDRKFNEEVLPRIREIPLRDGYEGSAPVNP